MPRVLSGNNRKAISEEESEVMLTLVSCHSLVKVLFHRRGCKNFILVIFSRPLLERNNMRRSISIENISFSRNCDMNITNAKSITDASIWVMFISKNSDTLEIAEHSLFYSPIIICCCGFHFRSTDLVDKPHS